MKDIRELRKKRGLSQQEVADALHVTRPTVVYWEQGKTMPHIKHISGLASILKCKPTDLLPKSV